MFWTKGDIDSLFTLSKDKKNFSLMLVNDDKMFNNGEYNFWSDDDSLFILETINYQKGKKNGKRTTYSPNGSELKVENYINDECN